jgi:hypothetical protein
VTRREAWASAGLVFVIALLVRAWAAGQIPFPIPEDATYYWGVARNLVDGHGLVSNAIWSYATPARDPLAGAFGLFFPRPAFEIWLPLPTLLAAVPMVLLGSTSYAATLPVPVLVGAVIPVLAWRIGADLAAERGLPRERARTLSLGSGLVSAVALPLVLPSALLDSTVPFGVAALAACLLGTRLLREPRGARIGDPRLLGLGLALGLAALARNEALWVALTWAALAWWGRPGPAGSRSLAPCATRLVLIPALVALVVVLPWLVRDWLVFGSPLPGQAITNAWALTGYEIFAWKSPATLAGYLAAGPAVWLGDRVDGFLHNLVSVLALPGMPIAAVGLAGLPWVVRSRTLRLLLVSAVATFAVTTLVFPVQTTWGTYLHASVPADVLIIVSGLAALDAGLAWIGRRRGWTRPVAWLGPVFAGAGALLFLGLGIPTYGAMPPRRKRRYASLPARFAALRRPAGPVRPRDLQPPDLGRRGGRGARPGPPGRAGVERPGDRPNLRGPVRRPRRGGRRVAGPARHGSRRPLPRAGRASRCGRSAGSVPRVPGRLPVSGPYTSPQMSAEIDTGDAGNEPFDGLYAEAKSALGYAANTLRGLTERYREAYHSDLTSWHQEHDELDSAEVQALAADSGDEAAPGVPEGTGELRRTVTLGGSELGARTTELARLELAVRGWSARGCSWNAATPACREIRPHPISRTTSGCGSWKPARRSECAWPRKSTTGQPRRSSTPSSRRTTSSGSSTPTLARHAASCASCASTCGAAWTTCAPSSASFGRRS